MKDIVNNNIEHVKKDNFINKTFFNKFHCVEKIGEGSFGSIYKAEYKGQYYALKIEKIGKNENLLENEAIIMNYLKGPYIPYIKFYGSTSDYNILVMQLLGRNLENIFEEKKSFSIKTVCMLGYQFVSILEYIHNKHILHRDIKPDNFVMGLNDLSEYVYLLDFGLAKKYRSSRTLKQIPLVNKRKVVGTTRYASINALKGFEHSRKDDLEAAGYILIYFIKGKLPWQGITSKNKVDRYRKLLKSKIETTPKQLCEGLPEEFEKYISYTRNLEYLEQPDYEMLKGLFTSILKKTFLKFDYIYNWTTAEEISIRRIYSDKNEIESRINNKKSLTSRKLINDNEEDPNKRTFYMSFDDSKKNLFPKYNCNEDDIYNKNVNNFRKNNKIIENEEAIIFSKRKDYLNSINSADEAICCTSECILF